MKSLADTISIMPRTAKDHEHRELEPAELLALKEALPHDKHERGAAEHQHLHEAREVVDDECAVERRAAALGHDHKARRQ